MQQADQILFPEWIFTAQPHNDTPYGQSLTEHGLVILNGEITDVAPKKTIQKRWQSDHVESFPGHILLPGFVNSHCHAAMTLLRGIANDLPLMDWLENHIWPAESAHVSDQFVYDGSLLAAAEMIRCGTTTFNDMYFFPDATIRAARTAGMRISAGVIAIDFPSSYAQAAEQYLSQGLETLTQHQHDPMVSMMLAPHAPYTVNDQLFTNITALGQKHELGTHVHLHETAFEVDSAKEQTGQRPFTRLQDLGVLNSKTLAVHMTQLSDDEIKSCAHIGLSVAHCPESNLKLASGHCQIQKLLQAGVNVCIGTDGAASNNDLDMLSELRSASLMAKTISQDATAVSAAQSLQMATYNGAKALNLDHKTGSIAVGKSADLQLIDLNRIETQPCYDPVAQVVYSASRDQITHVWNGGKLLMQNRKLCTLNEDELIANAREWHEKINA